ncbi:glycoside hydrolase family 5 protein [Streptomyces sp. TRM68416]|uniref:glycoside hydrolase family 5 protein n=1 Tax=Streptomyces sp. TRM68416 TaxID=2758412 RepID=UPI001661C2D4|nr:cellulase family glycosylhydrolase [Streptomyces sp. TRM68416]MBD0839429.1 cellulase family glycosylhydrolase [Streptomyces sp. TRM68416]
MYRRLFAALVCCALLGAGTAAHAEGPPGAARDAAVVGAPLAADIPRITDDRGRTLTLRGWNVEDKVHRGEQALSAITERHFRDLHRNGFNFARLLVFWDDLEPERGKYSKDYLRRIERVLDWAHKYRIHVLIDAHQDVFGPAFGHRGIPAWATRTDGLPFTPHPEDWFSEYFEPAVQRAFTHLYEDADLRRAQADMWRVLAGRFAHHPAVLGYDLINEPMGELRPGEDLLTAAARIEAEQITPMYNRLVDAVRSVDRDSWIFFEPTPIVGEGVPTALGRIDDAKTVYAPHFYNTAMEAGADYDPAAGWIEAYEAAVTVYPRQYGVPVLVGEWGPLNNGLPNMGRFYRDALDSLGRYTSGWAGYVWCYGGGYCALDDTGALRPNKDRTAAPYAAAVAGTITAETHAPDTGAHRLVYRAGHGVTEIRVPAGPGGWRITVKGPAATPTPVLPADRPATARVHARPGAEITVSVTPR